MTSRTAIENRLNLVKKYLRTLRRYPPSEKKSILADEDKRGALERYLYLVAQATIDLAEAVIAYKKMRKPTTMRDAFTVLAEEGLIKKDLEARLEGMVGFRNVLTNEYVDIDYDVAFDVLASGTEDIKEFAVIMAAEFGLKIEF
ncbi:MAG: type VII toxin-antitoxin system HepT family RNase toxin [Anaerolineales bacterium]